MAKKAKQATVNPKLVTLLESMLAFFFLFFLFSLGGTDILYTRATITTSKKRDVHCKP